MNRLVLFCLSLCLAAGTGCSGRSRSPDLARVDMEAISASQAPVNILDHDLRDRVAADLADKTRLSDGCLEIRVNLRNSSRKDLDVLARTVFKDEKGISLGDETEWKPVFFAPQQIQTYVARSQSTEARLFTVEVRRP